MSNISTLVINGETYTLVDAGAVAFDKTQALTAAQQLQALQNIGAARASDVENEIDRLDEAIALISPSTGSDTGGSTVTVDDALNAESENPVQNKVITQALMTFEEAAASLIPDTQLSETSENPVQNKVITAAFNQAITDVGASIQQLAANSLPTVTADDDGKFLRVVDGAWAAAALSSAEEASF